MGSETLIPAVSKKTIQQYTLHVLGRLDICLYICSGFDIMELLPLCVIEKRYIFFVIYVRVLELFVHI